MPLSNNKQILPSFGKASLALADFLREADTLDMEDQIFIENHLVILQLAYSTWKRGHHGSPGTHISLTDSTDRNAA